MSSDDIISDEEWENRELCSDGNCIGVIGPDGLCTECGRPGKGGPVAARRDDTASDEPAAEGDCEAPAAADAASSDGTQVVSDDDDWANRRLCPDGNCIGVIGPDGRCKECGRPAE